MIRGAPVMPTPDKPALHMGRGCVKTERHDPSRRVGFFYSLQTPLSLTTERRLLGFSTRGARPPEFSHMLGPEQR